MVEGRQWIEDGPKRRRQRELRASILFATLLAALFFVFFLLDDEGSLGEALVAGPFGFALGYFLAKRRKRESIPDFVRDFASHHGFSLSNEELSPVTPLLQQPFSRTRGVAFGEDHGLAVSVAPFDYVRESRWHAEMLARIAWGKWGKPRAVGLAVAVAELADVRRLVPVLLCERRFGPKLLDSVDDAVRRLRHLDHESVELDAAREIFVLPEQDDVWPRRLLSPSFISWHGGNGRDVSWELVDGHLVVVTPRSCDAADELKRCLLAFRVVSKRILEGLDRSELALERTSR